MPPSRCSARNARRKSLVLPKLVGNALDRASPNSKRLGHLQDTLTPRKLRSHLAFGRSVYLRATELHALSDRALEACFVEESRRSSFLIWKILPTGGWPACDRASCGRANSQSTSRLQKRFPSGGRVLAERSAYRDEESRGFGHHRAILLASKVCGIGYTT